MKELLTCHVLRQESRSIGT
ncbi:hypothetical protein E2C01_057501 [Portunus trituberculatus]|uniref:Uncharacterized protein n=1 Tax=Portunus trituberculatus TaxID=210409 RepID=A0A5B7H067_PORTR|nr:hypothetical protein [Portunus trituberculatus]